MGCGGRDGGHSQAPCPTPPATMAESDSDVAPPLPFLPRSHFPYQVLVQLRSALASGPRPSDEVVLHAKLCVFGICNALSGPPLPPIGAPADAPATAFQDCFPRFCEEYTLLLLDQCLGSWVFESPEAEKLCIGCIEGLAQTVVAYDLPALSRTTAGVAATRAVTDLQPVTDATADAVADTTRPFSCLGVLVRRLQGKDTGITPYLVAVLQAVVKKCGDGVAAPLLLTGLANAIVEPMVRKANQYAVGQSWVLVQSCLHTLFLLVYALKQVHPPPIR